MANPNINQFALSTVAGQPDLQFAGSVVSARVSPNQATALVPGQPVKRDTALTSGYQGLPNILATTADTDPVWGIVLRNLKNQNFPTESVCEVARDGTVVYLPASGAIAPGVPVYIDFSTLKVSAYNGINTVIGESYDQAVNNGDLIRVWIKLSPETGLSTGFKTIDVVATLAQINAGLVLIPSRDGASIRVSNFVARVTGAFASGTSVELESTTTAAAVVTLLEAALTNGAILIPGSANVTLGADYGKALPAGESLSVVNNGAAQTVGTSIEFTLTYQQY